MLKQQASKKNLIYISALDGFGERLPYGIKSWQEYCQRHNINLIVDTYRDSKVDKSVNGSWYPWYTPSLHNFDWDNVLIVDADTMVSKSAPNLFNLTNHPFSVVKDSSDLNYGAIPHFNQWRADFTVNMPPTCYFNAGFILLDHTAYGDIICRLTPFFVRAGDSTKPKTSAWEQTPINIIAWELFGHGINYLDVKWNDMIGFNYDKEDDSYIEKSYVWHFTGPYYQTNWGLRKKLMKAAYEKDRGLSKCS